MSLDHFIDRNPQQPEDGIGLALSGGGYRAMVFHVGALIRLNETALLRKVKRISSALRANDGETWTRREFTLEGRGHSIRWLCPF
jgi:hypothetical protein